MKMMGYSIQHIVWIKQNQEQKQDLPYQLFVFHTALRSPLSPLRTVSMPEGKKQSAIPYPKLRSANSSPTNHYTGRPGGCQPVLLPLPAGTAGAALCWRCIP